MPRGNTWCECSGNVMSIAVVAADLISSLVIKIDLFSWFHSAKMNVVRSVVEDKLNDNSLHLSYARTHIAHKRSTIIFSFWFSLHYYRRCRRRLRHFLRAYTGCAVCPALPSIKLLRRIVLRDKI